MAQFFLYNKTKRNFLNKISNKFNRRKNQENLRRNFLTWRNKLSLGKLNDLKNMIIKRVLKKVNKKYHNKDNLFILRDYFNRFIKNVSFIQNLKFSDMLENLSRVRRAKEIIYFTFNKIV